jgi:serine/threonine protein kinase
MYSTLTDIYSMGVVLYQLLVLKKGVDIPILFKQISDDKDFLKKMLSDKDPIYLSMLEKSLVNKEEGRATAKQLLEFMMTEFQVIFYK